MKINLEKLEYYSDLGYLIAAEMRIGCHRWMPLEEMMVESYDYESGVYVIYCCDGRLPAFEYKHRGTIETWRESNNKNSTWNSYLRILEVKHGITKL